MLFTGTWAVPLGEQHRLTLPKDVRELLGQPETLLLTPGPDQCLWLCSPAGLARLTEARDRPAGEAQMRAFRRLYLAQTEKSAVDKDGQCRVPERLAQFAGLRQEVVLIGVGDHFELWDAQRWQDYVKQSSAAAGPRRASP